MRRLWQAMTIAVVALGALTPALADAGGSGSLHLTALVTKDVEKGSAGDKLVFELKEGSRMVGSARFPACEGTGEAVYCGGTVSLEGIGNGLQTLVTFECPPKPPYKCKPGSGDLTTKGNVDKGTITLRVQPNDLDVGTSFPVSYIPPAKAKAKAKAKAYAARAAATPKLKTGSAYATGGYVHGLSLTFVTSASNTKRIEPGMASAGTQFAESNGAIQCKRAKRAPGDPEPPFAIFGFPGATLKALGSGYGFSTSKVEPGSAVIGTTSTSKFTLQVKLTGTLVSPTRIEGTAKISGGPCATAKPIPYVAKLEPKLPVGPGQ